MNKLGHLSLGIILALIFIFLTSYFGLRLFSFSIVSIILMSFIVAFYSLLPDLDHPNGTMHKWFFAAGIFGLLVGMAEIILKVSFLNPIFIIGISTVLLTFIFIATNFFEHRGIIHSIPAGILSVIPVYFIFGSISYCFLAYAAWHSHLFGDGYVLKWR